MVLVNVVYCTGHYILYHGIAYCKQHLYYHRCYLPTSEMPNRIVGTLLIIRLVSHAIRQR